MPQCGPLHCAVLKFVIACHGYSQWECTVILRVHVFGSEPSDSTPASRAEPCVIQAGSSCLSSLLNSCGDAGQGKVCNLRHGPGPQREACWLPLFDVEKVFSPLHRGAILPMVALAWLSSGKMLTHHTSCERHCLKHLI